MTGFTVFLTDLNIHIRFCNWNVGFPSHLRGCIFSLLGHHLSFDNNIRNDIDHVCLI